MVWFCLWPAVDRIYPPLPPKKAGRRKAAKIDVAGDGSLPNACTAGLLPRRMRHTAQLNAPVHCWPFTTAAQHADMPRLPSLNRAPAYPPRAPPLPLTAPHPRLYLISFCCAYLGEAEVGQWQLKVRRMGKRTGRSELVGWTDLYNSAARKAGEQNGSAYAAPPQGRGTDG